jgi:hypothetical protein
MDTQRFDSLTKALATGTSRRSLLKLFAGGAVATGLAAVKLDDATAQDCAWGACSSSEDCDDPNYPDCDGTCCVASMSTGTTPAPAESTGGTTSSGATVTTVTNTGSGPVAGDSRTWMGLAAAGGVAAWVASKLHQKQEAEAGE